MNITVQLLIALAASIYLALKPSRLFGIIGAAASALALLIAHGTLSLDVGRFPLGLFMSAAIAVAGGGAWLKLSDKTAVTVATALALIGVLRFLALI